MEFSKTVMAALGGEVDRLSILDQEDPIEFESLDGAVVTMHATWSGPSVKVIVEYTRIFRRALVYPSSVKYYILNFEKLSSDYLEKIPGVFGGNGETYMIKHGHVLSSLPHYSDLFESELLKCFSPTN